MSRFHVASSLAALALACVLALPGVADARSHRADGCGAVRSFSGNGGKNLGTLAFPRDATLHWTNSGQIFQIFATEDLPVNSQAHRGTTVIGHGTLHHFQVNAIGDWKITLTPRCATTTSGSKFTGNGGKNLGTIHVAKTSVLTWTNSGDIFQIFSSSDVPVNSQAHRGTTVLEPGTYSHFQVNAIGSWTISIKPRS
jgi:FlaG/FlaF family flagellin (archaellin)